MKIIYCMASVHSPVGMERVLLNKVRYLWEQGGNELTIVTTDQGERPPFYTFPSGVKLVDLDINYTDDLNLPALQRIPSFLKRRRLHRKRLTAFLMAEKADIVVSLYPSESSFIPFIRDGSKKVLELHYNKFFRLQYARSGLLGLIDRFRTWEDERIVRRFDRFVVLTQEDAGYWGALPNLQVIPNAALPVPETRWSPYSRRVIAVGRLDYQKGFDRLVKAWALLPSDLRASWQLEIFGQGEWEVRLQELIRKKGVKESARVNPPTKEIFREYAASSFLVMSSHYEGFPMVLLEAMACGLPGVCFTFPCGPKDVIEDGKNGLLVPEGDIPALAGAMERLMRDQALRDRMSTAAREIIRTYSEEKVMQQWIQCFNSLLGR